MRRRRRSLEAPGSSKAIKANKGMLPLECGHACWFRRDSSTHELNHSSSQTCRCDTGCQSFESLAACTHDLPPTGTARRSRNAAHSCWGIRTASIENSPTADSVLGFDLMCLLDSMKR